MVVVVVTKPPLYQKRSMVLINQSQTNEIQLHIEIRYRRTISYPWIRAVQGEVLSHSGPPRTL